MSSDVIVGSSEMFFVTSDGSACERLDVVIAIGRGGSILPAAGDFFSGPYEAFANPVRAVGAKVLLHDDSFLKGD